MGIQQVKMCYICREEERYDGVWPVCLSAQRVDLTTCSSYTGEIQLDAPMSMHSYRSRCATEFLLASICRPETSIFNVLPESCLLHWIQSSQENQARAEKAFKCPQCGMDYEIESDNPPALRLLNKLNKTLTSTGKFVTLIGMGTTIFMFGTGAFAYSNPTPLTSILTDCVTGNAGVYLMFTSYGAWAIREFLGQEM